MQHSSIYGAALIVGSLGAMVTMLFHPTGHDLLAPVEQIARKLLQVVLMNNGLLNQAFAKVFVAASSCAVIFWSVCLLQSGRFAQSIGVIGCVVGAVSLAGLFSGHLRLNVHGFGLFILGQSVWSILLGALLCRSGIPLRAA